MMKVNVSILVSAYMKFYKINFLTILIFFLVNSSPNDFTMLNKALKEQSEPNIVVIVLDDNNSKQIDICIKHFIFKNKNCIYSIEITPIKLGVSK